MPTPDDDIRQPSSVVVGHDRSVHATCPPEIGRLEEWRTHDGIRTSQSTSIGIERPNPNFTLADSRIIGQAEGDLDQDAQTNIGGLEQDQCGTDGQRLMTPFESPRTPLSDTREADSRLQQSHHHQPSIRPILSSHSTSYEFSNIRQRASHTSSFLRAGSKFRGTQQSDRQIYKVEVDIKHVDMNESFLCGYLRIEGLTEDHPTLTTYFEGEIVGPKYTFQTKHDSWGATDKTDMQHWARFPAWRPLAKQAKKPDFHYKNCAQRENIFMRWKEYFLVPDHRVREILGASFEGFYYICFNQVAGTVSGIYFHAKSEKYQQLELSHVDDKGCLAAVEFR